MVVAGIIKIIGLFLKEYPRGEAPIKMPANFRCYNSFFEIPKAVLDGTARAYKVIFEEPPWNEAWECEKIIAKIEREISSSSCSFFTIMKGNSDFPVGGFCWGSVIPKGEIPQRVMEAHAISTGEALDQVLNKIKGSKVLFVDEVAILKNFRKGIAPLQFLFRDLLEISLTERVGIICWTSRESKIYPFLLRFGFKRVGEAEDIVFLYAPPSVARALAKIDQGWNFRKIQKIISFTAKIKRARN